MEAKLLEADMAGTPAHNFLKSSRPTLRCASQSTVNFLPSNLGRNSFRPPQVSCSFSVSSSPSRHSKRIHYGKFVAEAKFLESPSVYEAAIRVQDRSRLMELLTYETVEAAIEKRVEMNAKIFGQDVKISQEEDEVDPAYKIKPRLVASLFRDSIMPLMKQVQVEYLLRRLD